MSAPFPDSIQRLYSLNGTRGIKLGLETATRLNQSLGNPHQSFASVHIAGSNGKGSVTTKIARAFELAGYRVGCYTSPHLSCYRERIRINGQMIPEAAVQERLPYILALAEQLQLPITFFEAITALAFDYFAQQRVDVAVLETGLGGRLDATNIITPEVSIITTLSLEHTETLGMSIDEIAYEKGGIIKSGVPVVAGSKADVQRLRDIAKERNSPYYAASMVPNGDFDAQNSATATIALQLLTEKYGFTQGTVLQAMATRPPCRIEFVDPNLLQKQQLSCPKAVILDVAHNPEGVQSLIEAIDMRYPGIHIRLICGFSKGKDVLSCLRILRPRIGHFYLIAAAHDRALPIDILENTCLEAEIPSSAITTCPIIGDAVALACHHAAPSALVLICGSFFIMGEVRTRLGFEDPTDPVNLNERSR